MRPQDPQVDDPEEPAAEQVVTIGKLGVIKEKKQGQQDKRQKKAEECAAADICGDGRDKKREDEDGVNQADRCQRENRPDPAIFTYSSAPQKATGIMTPTKRRTDPLKSRKNQQTARRIPGTTRFIDYSFLSCAPVRPNLRSLF